MLDHLSSLYVQLRPSSIEGVGCFAFRPIPKGTVLFESIGQPPSVTVIDRSDLDQLDEQIISIVERYCYHDESIVEIPSMGLNYVSLENYLNHSFTPNLTLVNGRFVTARDIEQDEELTFDYDWTYNCKHEF